MTPPEAIDSKRPRSPGPETYAQLLVPGGKGKTRCRTSSATPVTTTRRFATGSGTPSSSRRARTFPARAGSGRSSLRLMKSQTVPNCASRRASTARHANLPGSTNWSSTSRCSSNIARLFADAPDTTLKAASDTLMLVRPDRNVMAPFTAGEAQTIGPRISTLCWLHSVRPRQGEAVATVEGSRASRSSGKHLTRNPGRIS